MNSRSNRNSKDETIITSYAIEWNKIIIKELGKTLNAILGDLNHSENFYYRSKIYVLK